MPQVVLPEGASDITYSLPFDVEASRSVKYTYLDVSGRPVLVLRKAHVVPEHATKLTVDYSFPAFGEAREPLLLVAGARAEGARALSVEGGEGATLGLHRAGGAQAQGLSAGRSP